MTSSARKSPGIERGLAIAVIVGGALAMLAGSPTRAPRGAVDVTRLADVVEREEDHVTATELARWIRDDKTGLRVIDIRPDSDYAEFHVPGALRADLREIARMPLDSGATYVLYSEGGTHAAQGWFLLKARGVENAFFLRGGLYEWLEQIMAPQVASSTPQAVRDSVRALTIYFGGKMTVVDSAAVPSVLDGELSAPRTSSTRDAIRKVRRRAC
ncbi:MAG TPA: rhodanese-like domain-containing protein [Gemmatimonadaceae bacterium]|nr:rhodanese-like domain-containing protein [Gemmatimonadaceae bacterium]